MRTIARMDSLKIFFRILVLEALVDPEYVVRCAIWYHLYNLKNVKNTHEGVHSSGCFSRF